MEAELLCISTSMVKMCPQLPLLQFCCLQGLLFLYTGITSHTHTSGAAPGKALETGKGFGQKEAQRARGAEDL